MDVKTAIIIFNAPSMGISVDLEVPLNISANDLFVALNSAYHLGLDSENIKDCYLRAEYPIALLKGSRTLAEFGIRNGSVINFREYTRANNGK